MRMAETVVILGATPKEDRFAYKAMQSLLQHGYNAVPVNPAFAAILGKPCLKSIADVEKPIDTVTMYVGAARSEPLIDEIVEAAPRRIIFNPGAENEQLAQRAQEKGIEVVHGCTLVLLAQGAF